MYSIYDLKSRFSQGFQSFIGSNYDGLWKTGYQVTSSYFHRLYFRSAVCSTDVDLDLLCSTFTDQKVVFLSHITARGIEIVPATGRTMRGLPDELRNLPGVHYAILTNGAQVVDLAKNEIIDSCRIPVALAEKIMMMARTSPDEIMYDVYIGGIGYTMPEFYNDIYKYVSSEGLAELVRRTRDSVPDNIAYLKERGQDADKINMFFCDMDARKRMREELSKIPGILVSSSIPNNLEINAEGADKGGALIRLAARLGIDREATMSFGDGENDLSMIRIAGIGVAMENGEESVKAAADYITKANNEAGVAKAICHFTGIE